MVTVSNIVQATPAQLIAITYDLFIERIEEAIQLEDESTRKQKINQTREVLAVLTENLDMKVELAQELFRVYVYIQNILINKWKDDESLEEAKKLIQMLSEAYKTIDLPQQAKAVDNAQDIYAGMTYGRGYLNEMTLDSSDRGYKA